MFAEECVFQRQNQADRIGEQYREDTKVNFVGQILAGRKTSLAMLDVVRVVYSLAGARGSEFNQVYIRIGLLCYPVLASKGRKFPGCGDVV